MLLRVSAAINLRVEDKGVRQVLVELEENLRISCTGGLLNYRYSPAGTVQKRGGIH